VKRWSEKRLHRMAAERRHLALAWQIENERAAALGPPLPFAYTLTPPARVPQMVKDRAAGMLNYCRAALDLGPVSIVWIEWELKGRASQPILYVRTMAICGTARTKGQGRSWSWQGDSQITNQPLMRKLQQDAEGDLMIVRWDLELRELLLTIAHEARHLWHAAHGSSLSPVDEDADCEAFAVRALKEISGGGKCNQ
jgi:hypothetical protein